MAQGKISSINDVFIVRKIAVSYTAVGGGHASTNLYTAAAYSGYTPIGVVGFKTNSPSMITINASIEDVSTSMFLSNRATSSVTATAEAWILYRKN